MENPILISVIRTVVPIVVGFVAVAAARVGFEIDDATIATALTSGISIVYYTLVRELETRIPGFGKLLGIAMPPKYDDVDE